MKLRGWVLHFSLIFINFIDIFYVEILFYLFFKNVFLLVNCILNGNFLTKLDKMPKLNKFET